jgi:hypothetical protein
MLFKLCELGSPVVEDVLPAELVPLVEAAEGGRLLKIGCGCIAVAWITGVLLVAWLLCFSGSLLFRSLHFSSSASSLLRPATQEC